MEVVAEGVETMAESHCLAEMDCTMQQGFLFSEAEWPPPQLEWTQTPA